MKNGRAVSIIFCGGCNPRIDRGCLANSIRCLAEELNLRVVFNRTDADLIIYLSGCSANCAWRYKQADKAHVIVSGAAVDAFAVRKSELVKEIMSRVRDYFERLENAISG